MNEGKYLQNYDLDAFRCDVLNKINANRKSLYREAVKRDYDSCGTAILSLLTGNPAKSIDSWRRRNYRSTSDYSDRMVIKYLKNHSFDTKEVTRRLVTSMSFYSEGYYVLGDNHVLLCNCLTKQNEASWYILHQNILFHNVSIRECDNLFFVNRPPQSIYVVKHKEWKFKKKR